MPLALDVLSDILSDPTFDPEELEREQNVIVQEIGAAEDTPDDLVFDHLQATAFPDQPVGRSILGTPETRALVRRAATCAPIWRATIARPTWWSRRPARSITATIVAEVERRFGQFAGPAAPLPEPATFRRRRRSRRATSSRCTSRSRSKACRSATRRLFSLQVFTNVLGGGMSSRLFQEVRENRGLCYSIYAFHAPYADTGMFGVYAGTDAADVPELMRVVVDEIAQRGRDASPRPRSPAPRRR